MPDVELRSDAIRQFLVEHLRAHPADIVRVAAEHFTCSRQAVHRHLRGLIASGVVAASGDTRARRYRLVTLGWGQRYDLAQGIDESTAWLRDIAPQLQMLPDNVRNIWHFGFTEMFNNVIDHAQAGQVEVQLSADAVSTSMLINDNGVGIFKKIQAALGLLDARHAVVELAKGKFSTDPANHSGEGIFFTSRMFDRFEIHSDQVGFSHEASPETSQARQQRRYTTGTAVFMFLRNSTSRTAKKIFDRFTSDDGDYSFDKTMVPVRLLSYGDDQLVSRSQAKRLLSRFDRFKVVVLDFSGVASVGQAFADEVFRVFRSKHPHVDLQTKNVSSAVRRMISRAETLASGT